MSRLAAEMSEQVQRVRAGINQIPQALARDFSDLQLSDPEQHIAQALIARRLARAALSLRETPVQSACPRLTRLNAVLDSLESSIPGSPESERLTDAAHDTASFYETFLALRLPGERRKKGVFYTPPTLVQFIVQALMVENPEQSDATGRQPASASPACLPLSAIDPSAGTGAFLVNVARAAIAHSLPVPSLTACELLPAACVVALARLEAVGVQLNAAGLAQRVFWSNALTEERPAWRDRKYDLILGNPPFGQLGTKVSPSLRKALDGLSETVRSERNRQPLADATVQFLALACELGRESARSLLGMVVNRTCFDGRLHGGLRTWLRETFPDMSLVDLGGETRAGPLKQQDQNVFDITQGVGIILGRPGAPQLRGLRLGGTRDAKFATLAAPIASLKFAPLTTRCLSDPWTFDDPSARACRESIEAEYQGWPSLADLMPFRSPGVKTSCDAIAFAFTLEELEFQVRAAGWGWDPACAVRAVYRYGDVRWLYYEPSRLGRPRPNLAMNVLPQTVSLITMRQFIAEEFSHLAVCRGLACHGVFYLGNRGQDYLFPLTLATPSGRRPNLAFDRLPPALHDPEQFLYYATAVLLSPDYGARYRDVLPRDFPRVPIVSDLAVLQRLCDHGREWTRWQLWLHDPEPLAANQGDVVCEVPGTRWGGSDVCQAFLKARRNRPLTSAETIQYQRLVLSLAKTAELRRAMQGLLDFRRK